MVINQIVIQSAVDVKKKTTSTEAGNSLLIPLKQRKLTLTTAKAITKPEETKQSPQLRRKTPNASAAPPTARDPSQPSIHSMFKLPTSVTVSKTSSTANTSPTKTGPSKITKTPPTKTSASAASSPEKAIKTEKLPSPKVIKVEKDLNKTSPTSASADSSVKEAQPERRKGGRVQKITVTKAQAAAMAKEGRIKIKDGKILLKK